MRQLSQVEQEFAQLCAKIGELHLQKDRVMLQIDAQLKVLNDKIVVLEAEAKSIDLVQKELAKQNPEVEPIK
jgi:hypothetical protein